MLKKNRKEFDERQLWIRRQVFMHGFIAFVVLLLLNAFLVGNDIEWANPFQQNLIILAICITIVSIEAIVRGVYFGAAIPKLFVSGVITFCSIMSLCFGISDLIHGAAFAGAGGLTLNGGSIIFCVLLLLVGVSGLVRIVIDKRPDKSE